ncbi:hypothetical protein Hypma_016457 [Hypsizygus marmoreus]|uniref:Uncharacterized protein n=1 Tax=Hypsizygus marmoreus TaxID=39966 RepID=A0A369J554_HYPMA|nr:hypothetical protein Hypma_016457 [Hypsizygus marmoreus]
MTENTTPPSLSTSSGYHASLPAAARESEVAMASIDVERKRAQDWTDLMFDIEMLKQILTARWKTRRKIR